MMLSLHFALVLLAVGPSLAKISNSGPPDLPVKFSDEKRVAEYLMNVYGSDASRVTPPVYNISETVTVRFGIAMIEADVDTSLRVLTSKLFLRYTWEDPFLRWNPEEFGGIEVVRLPIQFIWRPDIKLYNIHDLKMEVDDSALAVVYRSGTVLWVPEAKTRTRCALERGHEWACKLKFGSWTYDGYRLDLDFYNNLRDFDMDDYNEALWQVVKHSAQRDVKYYPCCVEPYPSLRFNLKLRRNYN